MRISDWSSDVCSSDLCMTESKAGTVELEARSLTEARPSAAMPVVESVRPIIWERTHLRLLDQRLLPAEVRYLDCRGANDVADAIHGMAVRGAPAIGIAAAYGLEIGRASCRERVGPAG